MAIHASCVTGHYACQCRVNIMTANMTASYVANSQDRSCRLHSICKLLLSLIGFYDAMSKQGKVFASHAVTAWCIKGLITLLRCLIIIIIITNAIHLRITPLL